MTQQLTNGFNHVAIVTRDLDRLAGFYSEIFGVELTNDEKETRGDTTLRHGFFRLSATAALHAFEFPDCPSMDVSTQIFSRGRVDHLAIQASSDEAFELGRQRLVDAGASTGEVQDFGIVKSVYFEDPDGLPCELAYWTDAA